MTAFFGPVDWSVLDEQTKLIGHNFCKYDDWFVYDIGAFIRI